MTATASFDGQPTVCSGRPEYLSQDLACSAAVLAALDFDPAYTAPDHVAAMARTESVSSGSPDIAFAASVLAHGGVEVRLVATDAMALGERPDYLSQRWFTDLRTNPNYWQINKQPDADDASQLLEDGWVVKVSRPNKPAGLLTEHDDDLLKLAVPDETAVVVKTIVASPQVITFGATLWAIRRKPSTDVGLRIVPVGRAA